LIVSEKDVLGVIGTNGQVAEPVGAGAGKAKK